MLDPWIIEEILQREEEERQKGVVRIHIFEDPPVEKDSSQPAVDVPDNRGVVIVPLDPNAEREAAYSWG